MDYAAVIEAKKREPARPRRFRKPTPPEIGLFLLLLLVGALMGGALAGTYSLVNYLQDPFLRRFIYLANYLYIFLVGFGRGKGKTKESRWTTITDPWMLAFFVSAFLSSVYVWYRLTDSWNPSAVMLAYITYILGIAANLYLLRDKNR